MPSSERFTCLGCCKLDFLCGPTATPALWRTLGTYPRIMLRERPCRGIRGSALYARDPVPLPAPAVFLVPPPPPMPGERASGDNNQRAERARSEYLKNPSLTAVPREKQFRHIFFVSIDLAVNLKSLLDKCWDIRLPFNIFVSH